jgi:hypothetical protein
MVSTMVPQVRFAQVTAGKTTPATTNGNLLHRLAFETLTSPADVAWTPTTSLRGFRAGYDVLQTTREDGTIIAVGGKNFRHHQGSQPLKQLRIEKDGRGKTFDIAHGSELHAEELLRRAIQCDTEADRIHLFDTLPGTDFKFDYPNTSSEWQDIENRISL